MNFTLLNLHSHHKASQSSIHELLYHSSLKQKCVNIFFLIFNSSSFRVFLNKNVLGPKGLPICGRWTNWLNLLTDAGRTCVRVWLLRCRSLHLSDILPQLPVQTVQHIWKRLRVAAIPAMWKNIQKEKIFSYKKIWFFILLSNQNKWPAKVGHLYAGLI